jgi:hypothetical protein
VDQRKANIGGPYKEITWGPPIKYVSIPSGEEGTRATLKIMKQLVLSPWGHRNPEVVWLARQIVEGVSPGATKDYRAQAEAILQFMKKNVDYRLDPSGLEYVPTPWYTLLVTGREDCFTQGTKVLLREGMRLVPVETLRKGDEIWGLDRWSKVTNVWGDKGVLPTWRITLNNGGSMRLTPDHKVFVARCNRHVGRVKSRPCACPVDEREVIRVRVSELRPGMVVTQPSEIDYGTGEMDPERALVEGLYLSDGWTTESRDFRISGLDGKPKEAQKLRVQEICERLGIRTNWHRKYITVNDPDWTVRLKQMGTRAPQKRAPSINLMKECADALLEGILADSGKNTKGDSLTFTSTSYDLWLQARVLLKMQGMECSSWFIRDHGGLGKNPVWRLATRDKNRSDGNRPKLLRVKEVERDEVALPCFDIETDDHHVWLPEADWTVSQCDGHATAIAALAMALGMKAGFRTVRGDPSRPNQWSHVYAVIGIGQGGKTTWLTADSTQQESYLGWDPPEGKLLGMKTWVIDPSMGDAQWDT